MTCATVALLLVVSLGGKKLPWASPEILSLGAAALIMGTAFFLLQRRTVEPILPLRFLSDRVYKAAMSHGRACRLTPLKRNRPEVN